MDHKIRLEWNGFVKEVEVTEAQFAEDRMEIVLGLDDRTFFFLWGFRYQHTDDEGRRVYQAEHAPYTPNPLWEDEKARKLREDLLCLTT